MFHLRDKMWKDKKRTVISVRVTLIPQHISKEASGSGCCWRESEGVPDSLIWFYYLWNKVLANWPAGMWKWESHLSVVTAGWQLLMDLQNQRLTWQPRLADELWNETDIQKLQAAQTMPPPPALPPSRLLIPTPTSVGQCDSDGSCHALNIHLPLWLR